MAEVRALNLMSFTGGLNLRANEFQLGDTESPEMLNVEVDPRGGVSTRKGWDRWNTESVTADDWDPRNAFIHELANGQDIVLVANNDKVLHSLDGTWDTVETSASVDLVASADPHLMDVAEWGDDMFIACGRDNQAAQWNGTDTYASLLVAAETGAWNDNYLSPAGGAFPQCEFVCAWDGYVWAAGTYEDSTWYPTRVRWSHPNQPGDWAEADYIDLNTGGGPITAIVPMGDHLLVFKASSIFALYFDNGEVTQRVDVSYELGAVNRQAVCRGENAVFFVSWPQGVHRIKDGKLDELSAALRPALDSSSFPEGAKQNQWLGWLNQRLWWGAPYDPDSSPSTAKTAFVFDPSIGAWMMFRAACGCGVGPFAQGGFGQSSVKPLACDRHAANVFQVDELANPIDDIDGVDTGFPAFYRTGWKHAGWPERKKRWHRPTFIARAEDVPYDLTCRVFRDYEVGSAHRQFDMTVDPSGNVAVYSVSGPPDYGDGTEYGPGAEGSTLERGSTIGSAVAVQLEFSGTVGSPWGVDGLVLKYRNRRLT